MPDFSSMFLTGSRQKICCNLLQSATSAAADCSEDSGLAGLGWRDATQFGTKQVRNASVCTRA
jgi:hypothetical protein